MKVAIVGLPLVGKTSLFNALTLSEHGSQGSQRVKVVKVYDPRLEKLVEIYKPKKVVHATVEFVDTQVVDPGVPQKEKIKAFSALADVDALVIVLRDFENPTVPFPEGAGDPKSQFDRLVEELVFRDFEICTNRIEKLKNAKRKLETQEIAELKTLERLVGYLEDTVPLNRVDLSGEEKKIVSSFNFHSILPFVVALNTSEDGLNRSEDEFSGYPLVTFCGALESELAELNEEERASFMEAYGIERPVAERLTQIVYRHLGLITFFTAGEKEVHAWTVHENATALDAAGKIHSDMAKGFIRAEIMRSEDLIEYGSEKALRERGLIQVVGKDHPIEDGDVLKVRFNV